MSYCGLEVYAVTRMLSSLEHRFHMWGILLLPEFPLVHFKIEEKQLASLIVNPTWICIKSDCNSVAMWWFIGSDKNWWSRASDTTELGFVSIRPIVPANPRTIAFFSSKGAYTLPTLWDILTIVWISPTPSWRLVKMIKKSTNLATGKKSFYLTLFKFRF